jgi:hypothetical protein
VISNHVRHRHRLSRPGDAEQRLEAIAARESGRELGDRARLVAGGLEWGTEVEFSAGHRYSI